MAKMKTTRIQAGKAKAKDKGDKEARKLVAQNKKARHDYHVLDTYECGIALTGTEVKSLRQGRASLVDGFAQIDGGEVWLHNVHIPEYAQGTWTNHAARRKRKLLLHRAEIDKLTGKLQETGLTLVPLRLYFYRGRAKVEIALARGKKDYDKRQTLREKQDSREAERAMSAARRRQRANA
jgi:SsrA-binding protein